MVVPYDLAEEGGVKRHAAQLAVSLRQLGDEVDVLGPCSDPRMLGEHAYGLSGVVNLPSNGSANYLGIFASPLKVRQLLRARRYDVLHIHEPCVPTINFYATWFAGANAACVGTFHSFIEHESAAKRCARRFLSWLAFSAYDRAIAVSPAAADCVKDTFKKPVAIIPNGIRMSLYTPTRASMAPGPLKILFVGHWRDERKGLPYLLDACAALTARGVAWSLDVVGDGGSLRHSELPGVRYYGPIASEQHVAALYSACDVFVAPATGQESFGIVLLEAMAAGRPIVCSDIPGYRYAVGSGPSSGARLVPPQAVLPLADALAALAADPAERARLGALSAERVKQFDWDLLVAQVRDEYLAALASRRRSTTSADAGP